MKKAIPALIAALSVSACAADPYGAQYGYPYGGGMGSGAMAPAVGAVGGGAVSGLACSTLGKGNGKTAITAACALAGGLAGLFAGQAYSQSKANQSQMLAAQAQRQAMQMPGAPIPWMNQQNGQEGVVQMSKQYVDNQTGAYCREFQHAVKVNGRIQKAYGTACQQPDGSWKIVG